ncbi:MAG: hypothetical protein B0A82_06925 [Alkalinema sp. CACIAM 70d]|nr:MAG: hypothetical protein B0A82_06925 [Alkalinema sp. CACIAM 70d]
MVELTLEFTIPANCEVDSYTLGNLMLSSSQGTIFTDIQDAFMIFFSLTDLLDGLRKLITDSTVDEYEFVGVDSGFQVYFVKKHGLISIENCDRESIGLFEPRYLVVTVWNGVCRFLDRDGSKLEATELASHDLVNAIADFEQQFSLYR